MWVIYSMKQILRMGCLSNNRLCVADRISNATVRNTLVYVHTIYTPKYLCSFWGCWVAYNLLGFTEIGLTLEYDACARNL